MHQEVAGYQDRWRPNKLLSVKRHRAATACSRHVRMPCQPPVEGDVYNTVIGAARGKFGSWTTKTDEHKILREMEIIYAGKVHSIAGPAGMRQQHSSSNEQRQRKYV